MPIPPHLRRQLVDEFGFLELRAKKALWLNRMDVNRAVEWLVAESEIIQDRPITEQEFRMLQKMYGRRPTPGVIDHARFLSSLAGLGNRTAGAHRTASSGSSAAAPHDDEADEEEQSDDALQEDHPMNPEAQRSAAADAAVLGGQNHGDTEMTEEGEDDDDDNDEDEQPHGSAGDPDPALVALLQDMGFPESDCRAALRATHNDVEAASALLLGDQIVPPPTPPAPPPPRRSRPLTSLSTALTSGFDAEDSHPAAAATGSGPGQTVVNGSGGLASLFPFPTPPSGHPLAAAMGAPPPSSSAGENQLRGAALQWVLEQLSNELPSRNQGAEVGDEEDLGGASQ